jgi:lipid-A-disaccharide synthase
MTPSTWYTDIDSSIMKIFFSVGEPSGDLHGANLIRELRHRRADIECVGFGGPRMATAGCALHEDLTKLAVMGISRVLLSLHRFLELISLADRYFRHQRPDAVVLIDNPGFNWWVARRAKANGIPVFYYGTPQLWAWGGWRVRKMRRLVDHVLCNLPFEESWFRQRGCHATYVGHPYFDELESQELDRSFIEQRKQTPARRVTILPGSRTQEVVSNLPWFLNAARAIAARVPDAQFAVACFNGKQARITRSMVRKSGLSIKVHERRTAELIHISDCCMACSGSVSLELMYHGKPAVILYRISRLLSLFRGLFLKTRYITLVNLLTSDDIDSVPEEPYDPDVSKPHRAPYPEYLAYQDKSSQIAAHVIRWLTEDEDRCQRQAQLVQLRNRIGRGGASRTAAEYILKNCPDQSSKVPRPHYLPQRGTMHTPSLSPTGRRNEAA